MKVLAWILFTIVATAVVFGGSVLIFVTAPWASPGAQALAIFALMTFVYGPIILGSVITFWDVTTSAHSRRYFARWYRIILGLEVLASIAIVIFAVIAGAPVWLPVVFIGGGVVLMVVALVSGRALRRRDVARAAPPRAWVPIGRREILRKVGVVAIVFVAIFIVGVVLFGVLLTESKEEVPTVALSLLFAAEFAFMGASLACIIVSVPLNRRLREAVGGDLGLLRRVSKAVFRKKPDFFDASEESAAARFAALAAIVLPFQLAYFALLYVSIGLQQVQILVSDIRSPFGIYFLVALVVILMCAVPFFSVRIRRAKQYAHEHANRLPKAEAAPSAQAR